MIAERSSHTLVRPEVSSRVSERENHDGSWTEWDNLIGTPIEKTLAPQPATTQGQVSIAGSAAESIGFAVVLDSAIDWRLCWINFSARDSPTRQT
jgi:hypothetical protein